MAEAFSGAKVLAGTAVTEVLGRPGPQSLAWEV